jgi:hypothetical protein
MTPQQSVRTPVGWGERTVFSRWCDPQQGAEIFIFVRIRASNIRIFEKKKSMIEVRDWQANRLGAVRRTVATALLASTVALLAACGGGTAEGSEPVVRGDATTTATTVPGAPVIGTVTSSGVSMIVRYTAPASNGGLVIKRYTATANPGGITGTLATWMSGSIYVTGLTSGTLYTFTVTATNNNGTSSASSPSTAVRYVMDTSQD